MSPDEEAAGRPKDLAQLPILRDTLRVKLALEAADLAGERPAVARRRAARGRRPKPRGA